MASGLPLGVMTSMTRRAPAPSATIWKGAATGVFRKTRLALTWAARAYNTPAWAPTPMADFAPSTHGRFCSVHQGIGCRCSADAVTKPDPSSNSLSLEDSESISELDMPKERPSRLRTWVEGDSRRERPVTAGAIVIPIHFDIVVSSPRRQSSAFVVTSVCRRAPSLRLASSLDGPYASSLPGALAAHDRSAAARFQTVYPRGSLELVVPRS